MYQVIHFSSTFHKREKNLIKFSCGKPAKIGNKRTEGVSKRRKRGFILLFFSHDNKNLRTVFSHRLKTDRRASMNSIENNQNFRKEFTIFSEKILLPSRFSCFNSFSHCHGIIRRVIVSKNFDSSRPSGVNIE